MRGAIQTRRKTIARSRLMETRDASTEKLMQDLHAVVRDTENLLQATAGDASERAAKARAHAEESLRKARLRMHEMEQHLIERTREAAQRTNVYVHENPWPSIGVAAGIGVLVGILLGRR
jgi:ElaB/YqjD/DUF883 family membrane-anchored ribosome-binding protein